MSRPLQPYQRQVGLTVPAVPASPGVAFGQAAVSLANEWTQAQEQRQAIDVSKSLAEAKLAWAQKLVDAPGEVEPGAPGYAEKYQAEMRADLKERGKGYSGRAGAIWAARAEDLIGTLGLHAGEFEAKQRSAKVVSDVIETAETQAKAVRSNPALLDGAVKEVRGLIGSMTGVDPVKRREAEKDAIAKLGVSALEATFDRSPQQAYNDLQSGKFDGLIGADQKVALMNKAEREIKRLRSEGLALAAEGRRALGEEARATEQRVLMGKADPSDFTALATRFDKAGMPSQANLYREFASRGDFVRTFAEATTADQARMLAAGSPFVAAAGEASQAERQAATLAKQEETRLLTAYVKESERLLKDADDAIKAGARPDQMRDTLQSAYALASRAGNRDVMEKIERLAGTEEGKASLRAMSTQEAGIVIERHGARLQAEGGSAPEFVINDAMRKAHADTLAGYKNDPFKTGADRRGYEVPPMSLDPAALKVRARQADGIRAVEPTLTATMSPFTKDEMAALNAQLDKAPANQKAAMIAQLRDGLGPTWFAATMKGLADAGGGAVAWSAGLPATDARLVQEGAEVRKTHPKIVPAGVDLRRTMDTYINGAFRDSHAAHAMASDAVTSAYAKLAFDAGKTDGKFDADIADKAIKIALGPVVSFNSQSVFPPARDMTGAGFRDMMDRLTDADIPPLRTAEGDPITAATIRRYGVLSNAGDGKYSIRLPDRGGVLNAVSDPANITKPFILDVRPLMGRGPVTRAPEENRYVRPVPRSTFGAPVDVPPTPPPATPAPAGTPVIR